MRLVTFSVEGGESHVGALLADGEHILDFGAGDPLAWCDLDGLKLKEGRARYEARRGEAGDAVGEGRDIIRRADVRLLAPVPRPGKLICIGLNYRDHAAETNMPIPEIPVVFSKFATAVVGPQDAVVIPRSSSKVDYEAELAVVVGRRAKQVARERALDYVLGYTNFNDVTARDFQFSDGQWQRGKSCDTFAPMGQYLATADEIADPHNLSIKLRLNGQTMQDSNTCQLIFGVPELIAFLSETITLEPGDVIATGTPPGVGFARKPPVFIKEGDVMEVEIEGLGVLTNPVISS